MKYKIGDVVRICAYPPDSNVLVWETAMEDHCGQIGEVTGADTSFLEAVYTVKSTSKKNVTATWWYEESWLFPLDDYYLEGPFSQRQFQENGLKELAKAEASIRSKRDEIFKKMFSND